MLTDIDRLRNRLQDWRRDVKSKTYLGHRDLTKTLQTMQPYRSKLPATAGVNCYDAEFTAAPRDDDPVRRQIEGVIEQLKQDPQLGTMMSNANIRVQAAARAPLNWPHLRYSDEYSNKCRSYTFFHEMEEGPATVLIILDDYYCPDQPENLLVDHCHEVPLREWLIGFAITFFYDRRNADSDKCFWYNRGNEPFRLLDLPLELRLAIFEYVIAPSGEIYPTSRAMKVDRWDITTTEYEAAHVTPGIGYHREDVKDDYTWTMPISESHACEARDDGPAPDIALFYDNKQIHAEAQSVTWERLIRCFIDRRTFAAVATSKVGAAAHFNILGRIEHSFTFRAWFRFFGGRCLLGSTEILWDESASLAPYLRRLKPECRLAFRFCDPEDPCEKADPWITRKSSTCQTVLIDWVMLLAFEHIKHIKKLDLTGYIIKPQKEALLRDFQNRRLEDTKSDTTAKVQAIMDIPPEQLPPKCICPRNCGRYNYSRFRSSACIHVPCQGGYGHSWFDRSSSFDFEDKEDGEEK